MEDALKEIVDVLVPVVEAFGAAIVFLGALLAFGAYVLSELRIRPAGYEEIRLLLGRFLALGLEFQIGADILSTAVAPSWDEIGKLGAIVGIRTVLTFFLAHELRQARAQEVRV